MAGGGGGPGMVLPLDAFGNCGLCFSGAHLPAGALWEHSRTFLGGPVSCRLMGNLVSPGHIKMVFIGSLQ